MWKSSTVRVHELSHHSGLDRTLVKMGHLRYFLRMRIYVRQHIRASLQYKLNKILAGRQPGELHHILPGKRPFNVVHTDHLGPVV